MNEERTAIDFAGATTTGIAFWQFDTTGVCDPSWALLPFRVEILQRFPQSSYITPPRPHRASSGPPTSVGRALTFHEAFRRSTPFLF